MCEVQIGEPSVGDGGQDDYAAILFRSDDVVVRAIDFSTKAHAFLTFDSYTDDRTLDRLGFGERHFQTRGIPAIHVISRDNRWYQYPEMVDAIAAVRRWTSRFDAVTAYGSSMGGFAALTFAAACGASQGFALSPQFSVDPKMAPFEDRWLRDVAEIDFQDNADLAPLPIQYIAFDPRHAQDARHAEMFAHRSQTIFIRAPMGGHPVGAYLNEADILSTLLERIAHGQFTHQDAAAVERNLRDRRKSSGQYLTTLSARLSDKKVEQRIALTGLAVEAQPKDPGYRSLHGMALDRAGRFEEAEIAHRSAMEIPNAGVYPACGLVSHLRLRGNIDAAETLARELIATYPTSALPSALLSELLLARRLRHLPDWVINARLVRALIATVRRGIKKLRMVV